MRLEQEIQKIKNNSIEQNKIFKHWESKLFYDELDSLEKLSIKQLSLLSLLKKDYLSFFRLGEKKLKEVCEIISSDYDEEIWIDPVISLHSIDITNFDESNVWELDFEGHDDGIIHMYFKELEFDYIGLTH